MILLTYPFRIFFLLTALYGALIIPAWLGILFAGWPRLSQIPPLAWHAHEILFGLVPAAIAGFMLTAMATWTQKPALHGWGLAGLCVLWLAGRVLMWLPESVPDLLLALVDLSFLLVLAVYVAWVLVRARNWRNLVMVVLLLCLVAANALMHLQFFRPGLMSQGAGLILAMDTMILLMAVVGGRIIPAFTANWLRRQGLNSPPGYRFFLLDLFALLATALLIPLDLLLPASGLTALIALLAGVLHGVRWAGWQGRRCLSEPLLWVLHLGYAWLVLALLLKGLTLLLGTPVPAAWLHAAGAGAMATLILAVMTRVSLGHTGRPLRLPTGSSAIYALITLAALLRLVYALGWAVDTRLLLISGAAWSGAFVLFLVFFWPMLSQPKLSQ